jgi:hypothetical protein
MIAIYYTPVSYFRLSGQSGYKNSNSTSPPPPKKNKNKNKNKTKNRNNIPQEKSQVHS